MERREADIPISRFRACQALIWLIIKSKLVSWAVDDSCETLPHLFYLNPSGFACMSSGKLEACHDQH